jgi:S-adenosylmethionine:tRNA ribosyltransferase-isomerase
MKLDDFDYNLPEQFIAQTPLEKRDHSKLLTYNRATEKTEIRQFFNIIDYLKKGDVLVINNTRVIPARLFGTKEKTGAKIEVLLLKEVGKNTWETLVKPLKRLRTHETVVFNSELTAKLISKDEAEGVAKLAFSANPQPFGETPLPQYITKQIKDAERYQTVYNKTAGSVAAPTAGLHWTPELMDAAKQKGVIFTEVLLHVGIGTFRPVKVDNIHDHKMHSEYYEIPPLAKDEIAKAKREGRRVICVGTTSMRAVESFALTGNTFGDTDIFIYPPFDFKIADGLITNFHLPKSTLIMLVAAFTSREKILELYELAKLENFRFFSFGDCMFLS